MSLFSEFLSFFVCKHKYHVHMEQPIQGYNTVVGWVFVCRCENCGKLKVYHVRP